MYRRDERYTECEDIVLRGNCGLRGVVLDEGRWTMEGSAYSIGHFNTRWTWRRESYFVLKQLQEGCPESGLEFGFDV